MLKKIFEISFVIIYLICIVAILLVLRDSNKSYDPTILYYPENNFEHLCIHNRIYIQKSGVIAPIFDDKGKPLSCNKWTGEKRLK